MTDYFGGRIALDTTSVTIAQGATVSSAIDMRGQAMVAILLPSALTGTTMSFKGSWDGTNFYDAYNTSGTPLSIAVSTNRWVFFTATDFVALDYLQLVSGSAEAGARTIIVKTRSLT